MKQYIDISIHLDFDGSQPNLYGVDKATSVPFAGGGFIGDVRQGGSCNFEVVNFNPHCNGTHTESMGHVTAERISITDVLVSPISKAKLISLSPITAKDTKESYYPKIEEDDLVITKEMLINIDLQGIESLIIRTLPNNESKKYTQYANLNPAFFTNDAMEYLFGTGLSHLLVDLPSLDKSRDEGKLSNHRIWWGIEQGSTDKNIHYIHRTITELIFVPNDVLDGIYNLILLPAPFLSDASPSRPIIYQD